MPPAEAFNSSHPASGETQQAAAGQLLQSQLDILRGTSAADAIQTFDAATAEPTALLQPSERLALAARQAAKALFDYALSGRNSSSSQGNLYVDGFDAEQIWGQLEMQSGPLLKRVKRLIGRAGEEPALLAPQAEAQLDEVRSNGGAAGSHEEDSDSEGAAVAGARADMNGAGPSSDDSDYKDATSEQDEEGSDGEGEQPTAKRKASAQTGSSPASYRKRKLAGEDDFLRINDMEAFLREAEDATARQDDEDTESDDDEDEEEGERLDDGDIESGSDAEMAAMLDNANALVGRPKQGKGEGAVFDEADSGSEEEEADMYDSFFDPKPGDQDDDDMSEDNEGEVAEPDNWDGQTLFDTGEGRDAAEGIKGRGDIFDDDDEEMDERSGEEQQQERLSKHERRQQAMQERIAAMEAQNIGEKDWFLRGEAQAGQRPLNSALELDLDFERTMRPPPAPTEEGMKSLEDLIKSRIAERQFDDVVRVAPPPPDKRKTALELDDKKSAKGLGEIYEEEYVKAAAPSNVVEERDAEAKAEARALMKALFAKLDALSHFHFAPKPVVEDMTVRAEVPALALEEVAPQVASQADMRYAGEVFRPEGLPQGDTELSREDNKRARAAKKRAGRKRRAQKDKERKERSVAAGGAAALPNRKSEAEAVAADKEVRNARSKGQRSEYTKSSKVFAKLADEQAAAAAGKAPVAARTSGDGRSAALLKL